MVGRQEEWDLVGVMAEQGGGLVGSTEKRFFPR
jgi:hypothetical protein